MSDSSAFDIPEYSALDRFEQVKHNQLLHMSHCIDGFFLSSASLQKMQVTLSTVSDLLASSHFSVYQCSTPFWFRSRDMLIRTIC